MVADVAKLLHELAVLAEGGDCFPVFMIANGLVTVAARLFVPLGLLCEDAFFVRSWRIIPSSMNPHRATADVTVLFIPSTFFAILRRVTPVFVNWDFAMAMPTINCGPF